MPPPAPANRPKALSFPRRLRHRLGRVVTLNLLWNASKGKVPWRLAFRGCVRGQFFRLRHRSDSGIFYEVVISDAYELRGRRFAEGDLVLDIGGHCGSFGFLCHLLGCRHVISYEALAANFAQLRRNYHRLPGLEAVHGAVFRSDRTDFESLAHSGINVDNTGGGNVIFGGRAMDWEGGTLATSKDPSQERVAFISLDQILHRFERVRLLKLDCEGSEFPILLTARHLARVKEIVGEYHEVSPHFYRQLNENARLAEFDSYRIEHLESHLSSLGFVFSSQAWSPSLGLFRARRE